MCSVYSVGEGVPLTQSAVSRSALSDSWELLLCEMAMGMDCGRTACRHTSDHGASEHGRMWILYQHIITDARDHTRMKADGISAGRRAFVRLE